MNHGSRQTNAMSRAYTEILVNVDSRQDGIVYIDAPGGTGKTFLLNLLLVIRMRRSIAIVVTFPGIGATLLDGCWTAHSTLKLPHYLTRTESPT